MKLTKNYILEGKCISKESDIEILKEEEFNDFIVDNKGNSISKEDINGIVNSMLKSFETDTAFNHTNFGDLNVKDELYKYMVAYYTKNVEWPSKEVSLDYILNVNARNP